MKIIVCVKEVAVVGDEIEIDGIDIDRDYVDLAINEWDATAVEQAVAMREAAGSGEVVVVTVGDEGAEDTMRRALAMGGDRGIRLEALEGDHADPVGVAARIAGVIRAEQADFVLVGTQSADAAHGATGAALAGHLGWPCAAVVREMDAPTGGRAIVGRELDGGVIARTDIALPAVLTIQTGLNQPRYATLRQIKQAADKEIRTEVAAESSQHARITAMRVPVSVGGATMLGDDPAAVASRIAQLIEEAR